MGIQIQVIFVKKKNQFLKPDSFFFFSVNQSVQFNIENFNIVPSQILSREGRGVLYLCFCW